MSDEELSKMLRAAKAELLRAYGAHVESPFHDPSGAERSTALSMLVIAERTIH
jgi:hypothetical protein